MTMMEGEPVNPRPREQWSRRIMVGGKEGRGQGQGGDARNKKGDKDGVRAMVLGGANVNARDPEWNHADAPHVGLGEGQGGRRHGTLLSLGCRQGAPDGLEPDGADPGGVEWRQARVALIKKRTATFSP